MKSLCSFCGQTGQLTDLKVQTRTRLLRPGLGKNRIGHRPPNGSPLKATNEAHETYMTAYNFAA